MYIIVIIITVNIREIYVNTFVSYRFVEYIVSTASKEDQGVYDYIYLYNCKCKKKQM